MPKVTKENTPVVEIEWEYEEIEGRMPAGGYDLAYMDAFCNDPQLGKTGAILKAGYVGNFARQEAYRIHNRLREQIEERLDQTILDGAHVGHSVLLKLAKDSESDTVKATCAKNLIDYAGRKAGDRITVTHEMSDDERDAEIDRLLAEEAAEGVGRRLDS